MFDTDLLPLVARLSPTIMWIALTVGVLLYIIGYFAGGRMTLSRIMTCTILVTLIGVLALPAPMVAYRIVKQQYDLVTVHVEKDGTITKIPPQTSGSTTKADSQKTAQTATNGAGDVIPVSFQVLTLVMYIIWTAFLVGMGIFFYETLIVTAEEIDKK